MGLLGNGDDSLTSNTGWGMMPPMNSGADWGSSSGGGGGGSSSSAIGANNSGNNHHHHIHHNHGTNSTMTGVGSTASSSSAATNCWQTPSNSLNNSNVGRNQMVSSAATAISNTSSSSNNMEHQALSTSPKLSSSWAQAAGKGLMASNNNSSSNSNNNNNNSNNMSFNVSNNSQQAISSNVIHHSSTQQNSISAGSVSSSVVSDRQTSSSSSMMIANNGPNQTNMAGGNYSHDSYSAAMNGSNNQQTLNSNGTTGSSSISSAFQSAAQHHQGANNNSSASSSSNENLSGGNGGINNNKRAINSVNIQDIIGNLGDDIRETLLTEKWRSPVINQDSPWNLPPSPQSSPKDTSQWRCPVNSGTEIWENTVRQKKSGGVGGNGNVCGVSNPTSGFMQMTGNTMSIPSGVINPSVSSQPWGQPTSSGGVPSIGGTWGDEEPTPANHWMAPMATTNQISGAPGSSNGNIVNAGGNPLSSISNWSTPNNNVSSSQFNNWNNVSGNDNAKSFDDRSCKPPTSRKPWGAFDTPDSGLEPSWDRISENSNSFGTWNSDPSKKESGWEKESNDAYKGPVDDGTAVWGNPVHKQKVSNWKDSKFGNNNPKNGYNNGWTKNAPCGTKPNQIPPNRSWSQGDNTSQQRKSPSSWTDENPRMNGNAPMNQWPSSAEPSLPWPDHNIGNLVNPKPNNKGHGAVASGPGGVGAPNHWMMDPSVDGSQWNHVMPNSRGNVSGGSLTGNMGSGAGPNQKIPGREMMGNNNNYKMLLGFKKEDNDNNALRSNQMRNEDALKDPKMLDDDLCRRNNLSALPSDRSRMNPLISAQQNRSSAGPGSAGGSSSGISVNSTTNISSYPNNQMLQLIQSAIQNGYLNPQIMHQPMSKHNIEILNELLQQFKLLRAVTSRGDIVSQMNVNSIKQNILNLQNQIHGHVSTAANSQFANQANRGGGSSVGVPPLQTPNNSIDFFKPNSSNSGNSNDLPPFDFVQPPQQPGSKLQTWKQSYKSDDRSNPDFVRAPGPLSKQNSNANNWGAFDSSVDPNNWSSDKPELPGSGNIDDYDLITDFSYKPWKPPGAKTLEDDPRSPLNIAMPKDPFPWNNNKTNSGGVDTFGTAFSNSNTWSYNPMPSTQSVAPNMFDLGQTNNNKSGPKKPSWSNPNATDYSINSDSLWSNASQPDNATTNSNGNNNNKPRPPPGLSGKMSNQNNNGNTNSNVWNSGLSNTPANNNVSSEYLRLRNLTPQIDGSTLKTLCLQHGPLNQFHLSLNHGVAIVRYATRDQAIKAQSALNNCVLGNTTIIADLPSDNEIQQYNTIGGGGNVVPTISTLSQQQQQQQLTNNLNSLAPTWSNGTNTSHSHTVAAAVGSNNGGSNNNQSYQSQQNQQAHVTGGGGSNGGSSSAAVRLINPASIASSSQTLPYGASAGGGSAMSTHSSSLPFGSNGGGNGANQYNGGSNASGNSKLDPTSGWNTGSMMWDNANPGAASNLWSASGFSTADRNTPIQSFLPNDLLAGENN